MSKVVFSGQEVDALLRDACGRSDLGAARSLLDARADPNATDELFRTPLLIASWNGCADVAALLVERSASLNAADKMGRTPLAVAAQRGDETLVRALIHARVDVAHQSSTRNTALHLAAEQGWSKCVRALLDAGAPLTTPGRRSCTPLHMACQEGHADVVSLLLAEGAPTEHLDSQGRSPLLLACQEGHVDCVRTLLAARACVDARAGSKGETALMLAADSPGARSVAVVELLLAARADVNAANAIGFTALMLAARGNEEALRRLLGARASVNAINAHGATALKIACVGESLAIVQALCAAGASRILPRGREAHAVARQMLSDMAIVHWLEQTRDYSTPLHHLALIDAPSARALLRAGADIDAAARPGGPTPLSLARELAPASGAESAAALVLEAALPWSVRTHALFPPLARAHVVELLRVGCLLCRHARFGEEGEALLHCWLAYVLPHAISRASPSGLFPAADRASAGPSTCVNGVMDRRHL
jgi:ankyrin repeat protein